MIVEQRRRRAIKPVSRHQCGVPYIPVITRTERNGSRDRVPGSWPDGRVQGQRPGGVEGRSPWRGNGRCGRVFRPHRRRPPRQRPAHGDIAHRADNLDLRCGIPGPSAAGRGRGGRLTARADRPAPDSGPCMIPQGLRPWTRPSGQDPGTRSLDPVPAHRASLRPYPRCGSSRQRTQATMVRFSIENSPYHHDAHDGKSQPAWTLCRCGTMNFYEKITADEVNGLRQNFELS
jgi:hypothetical protein